MTNKNDLARKKYLGKIQKLMRLANNTSSPEEAASAISKAQAFMRQHSISDTEVTFAEISTSSSKGAPSHAKKIPYYMIILSMTVEKAFGVSCLYSWRMTDSYTPKRVVSFYGQDGRDVVAAYTFDVLTRQLSASRKKFLVQQAWRYKKSNNTMLADKFCEGWASGAWHAVSKMATSDEQAAQMSAYTENIMSDGVKPAKHREAKECHGQEHATRMGYSEGKNAKLYHGVDTRHNEPAQIGCRQED